LKLHRHAAVQTNRAQAMLADRPAAAYQAKTIAGLRDLGNLPPAADDAIYLRLHDMQWLWYVNGLVQEMRCGVLYQDYAKAYEKWFGVKPPSQDICIAFSQADFLKAAGKAD
jgi:ABC-type amino acid transport substrate-binding protein